MNLDDFVPQDDASVALWKELDALLQSESFEEYLEVHPALGVALFSEALFFKERGGRAQLMVACTSFASVWERIEAHSRTLPHHNPGSNPRLKLAHEVLNNPKVRECAHWLSRVDAVVDFETFRAYLKTLADYLGRDRVFLTASRAFLR